MPEHDRHAAGERHAAAIASVRDAPERTFDLLESKYMAVAAVVGFLLTLLLTNGSLFAAFGALALIAGIGWAARRLMRRSSG
jgi:hypothetical protein